MRTMTTQLALVLLSALLLLQRNANAFLGFGLSRSSPASSARLQQSQAQSTTGSQTQSAELKEKLVAVPGSFRPSIVDKARTITHICTSGTLCTTSVMADAEGSPFGSYVDYVLDDNGWPVMLLSAQSLHTININKVR